MKTCGNCRYRGGTFGMPEGFFLCDRIKHNKGYPAEEERKCLRDGVFVEDGSGYHAALCVSTDFGCVKWEEA